MFRHTLEHGFGAGLGVLFVVHLVDVLDGAIGFDIVGVGHGPDDVAVFISDFHPVDHVLDAGAVAGSGEIGHICDGIALDDRVSPDYVQPVLGV